MSLLRKRLSSKATAILKSVLSPFVHSNAVPFTLVPWQVSYHAVEALLNAPDGAEKKYLVTIWKESKLQELAVIVVSSSLISGVISAAFSWPTTPAAPWTVRALWYSSLFLSLISISIAAFFSMVLLRVSCYPDSNEIICRMLGKPDARYGKDPTVRWRPRKSQLYTWQLPRMMLTASIFEFAIGLCLMIWDMARVAGFGWNSDEEKILISFLVAGGLACLNVIGAVCVIFFATFAEKTI